MPAELIDGNAIAQRVRGEIVRDVASLRQKGVVPGLSVILVGDDPASKVYVDRKERASVEVGMKGDTIRMPASTPQAELLARIDALNADANVHGILVQAPQPPHIDARAVIRRISPQKDVDAFHPVNVGKVLIGDTDGFAPCTPAGVMVLLRESGVELAGKDVVVVGRSNIVGKPMAALLMQAGADATVTVCHSKTRDLRAHVRAADVLIAAIGRAEMIRGDWIKPGAVVIDVGMNRVPDPSTRSGTRLCGDVHFASAREVASLITPVPGGVGPMTIAMLLRNTVRAAAAASGIST
ncbi:MAG TPA: bifunctional methylenetetrahydrofolate dehydrogenase/methenyltetrahydrofolate cyclohydrolase FolD [Gemmatimonadaceae bacterium]|nr:bifunctional methylenetetrahydrofolate dehydrogenase/methenyltetrahydrofolate cyclohydrolase FolD [Gemmatimonadaceae bacterium]